MKKRSRIRLQRVLRDACYWETGCFVVQDRLAADQDSHFHLRGDFAPYRALFSVSCADPIYDLKSQSKGEDRHKLARAVFRGKQGELRQRYREGQEDQLGALGLVVNMIVLWNTLYINAALEQLVREGHHVTSEVVARLSPLVFDHINLLGRYAFSVPEAVTRGELRPLRNPAEVLEEVA